MGETWAHCSKAWVLKIHQGQPCRLMKRKMPLWEAHSIPCCLACFCLWWPSTRDTSTLLKSLGHYIPPKVAPGTSWMPEALLGSSQDSLPSRHFYPTACLNIPRVPVAPHRTLRLPFHLWGSYTRNIGIMLQSLGLYRTPGRGGGFWDKKGLPERIPAFPAVSPLCPSVCLKLPLSPSSPPTPPVGSVFLVGPFCERHRHPASMSWALQPS